jgi:hypothetical protein
MTDFPKLSAPAQRALAHAGYVRLEDLAGVSEADVLRLHGLGPSAMAPLREALAALGLSLG